MYPIKELIKEWDGEIDFIGMFLGDRRDGNGRQKRVKG